MPQSFPNPSVAVDLAPFTLFNDCLEDSGPTPSEADGRACQSAPHSCILHLQLLRRRRLLCVCNDMSVCLSACLSVCLSVCLCLPACQPAFLFVCLSAWMYVCLSVCLPACLSLSAWLPCLPVCVCLSVCLDVRMHIHRSVCMPAGRQASRQVGMLVCV